ncbi:MAG: PIN domain-containing protein [Eubacterium sp.]|nr:PIN domain-containing protein [Eubacterium sp.]
MKIYLDNCCYNRILNDRSNSQIYYKRNSVMLILELVEKASVNLVGSEMLVKEIRDIYDSYKRAVIRMMYSLCSEEIRINSAILDRAEKIRHCSNVKYKDSIHLACAEMAGADALLTTDKKFISNGNRIKTYTRVMNPNQWLSEVLY